jgi:hypothetical protein
MSFAGVQGRKEPFTEETFSHHVFPAANKLCHPHEILTRRKTELHLNVMKKLKSVTAEEIEAVTGCFYEITHVALMNPWRCSRAAALQSAAS